MEINYSESPCGFFDKILAFVIGVLIGFGILFVFYKIIILSIIGGVIYGIVNIFVSEQNAITKRKKKLRTQFSDLLEALAVAMRTGKPISQALESALEDLSGVYSPKEDIIQEIKVIIARFENGIPLSHSFEDFAKRSELEDIKSFASVYATIEGVAAKGDIIIGNTQEIISDKMEIEMEIDTLMTAAKSQVNIMLAMPLVILLIIGYAGAGFMDAIYTTSMGRIVATGGFIAFVISYIMAKKFSDVKI